MKRKMKLLLALCLLPVAAMAEGYDSAGFVSAVDGVTTTGIWFLVATVLVFFMQCGFAMVETGFTRAKNAGNIIMKNLMDFCVGTVAFVLLGYGLMFAEDTVMGLFGIPNLDIFTDFAHFNWAAFSFNLVFCATAATIVSGAMAERTKFKSYLVYSLLISLVVYPVEACWVWNPEGWLYKMGYIDFAGSSAIHMVGGISALIGAIFLGPRIGKYTKDKKTGKTVVHAIPGHSITLGALGVFILWFCWYGFNGAAVKTSSELAMVIVTTTIAAAVATCTTMLFTWLKNGKPDVSMTLNGSLAGLVAVTAGCYNVDALGAAAIGIISGILVVVVVEGIDLKLHIDDPVGAVAVHGANGMFGTIAVGLFATDGGLFYGGGFHLLGVQLLGVGCIALWTIVTMTGAFALIRLVFGLRVSREEELTGLDPTEHGLPSAYADFMPAVEHLFGEDEPLEVYGTVPSAEAVPVKAVYTPIQKSADGTKMTKVEIVCRERMMEPLKEAMMEIGITGMTVSHVMGCGIQKGKPEYYRGVEVEPTLLPKVQVDMVVSSVPVSTVIETAKKVLYTGHIGDGKIFVYDVENVIKVRTGEEGYDALQDVE